MKKVFPAVVRIFQVPCLLGSLLIISDFIYYICVVLKCYLYPVLYCLDFLFICLQYDLESCFHIVCFGGKLCMHISKHAYFCFSYILLIIQLCVKSRITCFFLQNCDLIFQLYTTIQLLIFFLKAIILIHLSIHSANIY